MTRRPRHENNTDNGYQSRRDREADWLEQPTPSRMYFPPTRRRPTAGATAQQWPDTRTQALALGIITPKDDQP
jgi:hypothetical protein